ncbi:MULTISPECIES: glycosyltransferase family 2 protein [unclassified Rathayibacter]|uniref:glycosyltransferase family 2 protein n=1 Tax=unclassified Rathayibacter TaxID=2609250 RepID=UPI000FBD1D28|nr:MULTISPECIES: glycosyltransferase [unclassified Rathayibacter]ROP50410.1 glycosyl transferase family 2 [Rathayibacter sp. PhB186]ROS53369.1 glycosyl transferase family 2 [Rathayibacter sp. PhB185]
MSAVRGYRSPVLPLSGPAPLVSVVIAAVDGASPLAALASVLAQRGVRLDVVVVTDADPVVEDERVRVLEVSAGLGAIAARNAGLALVRGESVLVLPSTDALTAGALERAAALLAAHPWVGAVHGDAEISVRPATAATGRVEWTLWSGADWIERTSRHGSDLLVDHAVLVRRSIADALGGYAEDLPRTADLDYGLRLAALGGIGRISGVVQTRCHPQPSTDPLAELRERRGTIEHFFTSAGHDSSGRRAQGGDRRANAGRALAHEAMGRALRSRASARPEDQAEGARFASIAAECWPAVVDTAEWRRFVRAGERARRPLS